MAFWWQHEHESSGWSGVFLSETVEVRCSSKINLRLWAEWVVISEQNTVTATHRASASCVSRTSFVLSRADLSMYRVSSFLQMIHPNIFIFYELLTWAITYHSLLLHITKIKLLVNATETELVLLKITSAAWLESLETV